MNKEFKTCEEYWEHEYHELKKKVEWGTLKDYCNRIETLIIKSNQLYQENKKLKDEKDKLEDILILIQDELYGEVYECHFHKLLDKIKQIRKDNIKNYIKEELNK